MARPSDDFGRGVDGIIERLHHCWAADPKAPFGPCESHATELVELVSADRCRQYAQRARQCMLRMSATGTTLTIKSPATNGAVAAPSTPSHDDGPRDGVGSVTGGPSGHQSKLAEQPVVATSADVNKGEVRRTSAPSRMRFDEADAAEGGHPCLGPLMDLRGCVLKTASTTRLGHGNATTGGATLPAMLGPDDPWLAAVAKNLPPAEPLLTRPQWK